MFKFETLDIWKRAVKFASSVYKLSRKFPKTEKYGLVSQLTRAAVSVSLNIAEGSSRESKVDFKRFIQMALGSLNEVVTCLYIALNEEYLDQPDFDQVYSECEEVSKMLYGFKNYLKA